MKVFISHAKGDHSLVHSMAGALAEEGIEPVVAMQRLSPGTRLDDKIEALINESDCVIVLNTPNASRSHWVQQEVGCAKAHGKHIVPLKTRRAPLAAMLQGLEYYQFRVSSPSGDFERVAAHLREYATQNGIAILSRRDRGSASTEMAQIIHLPFALLCPKCQLVEVHVFVCHLCGDWVCVGCGATIPPHSRASDREGSRLNV